MLQRVKSIPLGFDKWLACDGWDRKDEAVITCHRHRLAGVALAFYDR